MAEKVSETPQETSKSKQHTQYSKQPARARPSTTREGERQGKLLVVSIVRRERDRRHCSIDGEAREGGRDYDVCLSTFCSCLRHLLHAIGQTRFENSEKRDNPRPLASNPQSTVATARQRCFHWLLPFCLRDPKMVPGSWVTRGRGSSRWAHSGDTVAHTARNILWGRELSFFFSGMALPRRTT